MQVTRTSTLSGVERTMDLPITQDELDAYNSGVLIQTAFKSCNASQREFFMSGITDEEWDTMFANEEE